MSLKPKKVVSVKLAVYVTIVTHSSLAIHWRSDAVPCPITIYIGHWCSCLGWFYLFSSLGFPWNYRLRRVNHSSVSPRSVWNWHKNRVGIVLIQIAMDKSDISLDFCGFTVASIGAVASNPLSSRASDWRCDVRPVGWSLTTTDDYDLTDLSSAHCTTRNVRNGEVKEQNWLTGNRSDQTPSISWSKQFLRRLQICLGISGINWLGSQLCIWLPRSNGRPLRAFTFTRDRFEKWLRMQNGEIFAAQRSVNSSTSSRSDCTPLVSSVVGCIWCIWHPTSGAWLLAVALMAHIICKRLLPGAGEHLDEVLHVIHVKVPPGRVLQKFILVQQTSFPLFDQFPSFLKEFNKKLSFPSHWFSFGPFHFTISLRSMSAIAHGSDLVIAAIARMARKWSPPSPTCCADWSNFSACTDYRFQRTKIYVENIISENLIKSDTHMGLGWKFGVHAECHTQQRGGRKVWQHPVKIHHPRTHYTWTSRDTCKHAATRTEPVSGHPLANPAENSIDTVLIF